MFKYFTISLMTLMFLILMFPYNGPSPYIDYICGQNPFDKSCVFQGRKITDIGIKNNATLRILDCKNKTHAPSYVYFNIYSFIEESDTACYHNDNSYLVKISIMNVIVVFVIVSIICLLSFNCGINRRIMAIIILLIVFVIVMPNAYYYKYTRAIYADDYDDGFEGMDKFILTNLHLEKEGVKLEILNGIDNKYYATDHYRDISFIKKNIKRAKGSQISIDCVDKLYENDANIKKTFLKNTVNYLDNNGYKYELGDNCFANLTSVVRYYFNRPYLFEYKVRIHK